MSLPEAEQLGPAREGASRGPSPDLCRGLHSRAWGLGAAGSVWLILIRSDLKLQLVSRKELQKNTAF